MSSHGFSVCCSERNQNNNIKGQLKPCVHSSIHSVFKLGEKSSMFKAHWLPVTIQLVKWHDVNHHNILAKVCIKLPGGCFHWTTVNVPEHWEPLETQQLWNVSLQDDKNLSSIFSSHGNGHVLHQLPTIAQKNFLVTFSAAYLIQTPNERF